MGFVSKFVADYQHLISQFHSLGLEIVSFHRSDNGIEFILQSSTDRYYYRLEQHPEKITIKMIRSGLVQIDQITRTPANTIL